MNNINKYKGIIVPSVTPLTSSFQIDEAAVEKIFSNFYQHNISPFILGTTGEAASLPFSHKINFLQIASKYKKHNTILYAGISSNIFEESVELAKHCSDNGVDAVATTLPSYYALTNTQMQLYFENLANAISLPLIIYNIPATTHMSIPLDVIDALSYHPNIIAIKDSERNEERLNQSLQLWKDRDDFGYFLGWAAKSATALLNGASGLIPSTGNIAPHIYSAMLNAFNEGDNNTLNAMQQLSDTYGNLYQANKTLGESLWALKILMQSKNLCSSFVMPPLQPMSNADEQLLLNQLIEIENKILHN